MLSRLDPTARALLGRVSRACCDAVLRSPELACAGRTAGMMLELKSFVGSVGLLAWAKETGCPWNDWTSAVAA